MKRYGILTLVLLLALSTAACARTAATVREMAPDEQAMVYMETVVPQELDRIDFTFCCGAQVWLRHGPAGDGHRIGRHHRRVPRRPPELARMMPR